MWSTRGWTLQESLLSGRRLVFTETRTSFQVFPRKGRGKTGIEIEIRIQEYLGRHLSNESDALKAFLGIFQAFQELEPFVNNFWGLPMSRFGWTKDFVQQPNGFTEVDQLHPTSLSSLAWSNESYDHTNSYLLERRQDFSSWTWAAWRCLRKFSQKSITKDPLSSSVRFRLRKGEYVQLEIYEQTLDSQNGLSLFQPCVFF